ncbi:MAG TPA: hypothetical protein ENK18_27010 [Deltaproteobacteria bacterium]|nr:hypothetical protein [Deltaproteobacteria bacterium]
MDLSIPPGVSEAAELTSSLDAVLGDGFARLTPKQTDVLRGLAATFCDTPLHGLLSTAVEALAAGELLSHHLAVIAAARSALEGARSDALLAVAAQATGLMIEQPQVTTASAGPEAQVRMESARQWLVEIALAGLSQLDNATIVPVIATLEGIQALPELQGLAAMLTGFANELLDHAPTSALAEPPLRRWGDLWAHCMLLSHGAPEIVPGRSVSGTLAVLGADIRHHDHLLSLVVHGLLEEEESRRLVRTTLSAWKVDAVSGAEIWGLLEPLAPELIKVLAAPKLLRISDMVLAGGDLRWGGSATLTRKGADPFTIDLSGAIFCPPPPRDRHPIGLSIPLVLNQITVGEDGIGGVPVAIDRVSPHSDYDPPEIASSTDMVALLRFDGGWSLQPLAGRKGKKVFGPAQGIAAAKKIKKPALRILQERAGKLLRRS